MHLKPLFPGSIYVTVGEHALLGGCPPEIIKALIQNGLPAPQCILLPDRPVSHGESQVAVEFPLYHHLFIGCKPGAIRPLHLIGSARRVSAARELLGLTLFGPDIEQMQEWGLPESEAQSLAREMRWFHLKDKGGKPLLLDDLIVTHSLDEGAVDLGWGSLRRLRPNVFELTAGGETAELDLQLDREQVPPYPVNPDLTPTTLVKLGVEVIGGSTGFSALQASSGLALCYNGNYLLIDAIPYLSAHLRARGIARNQIHGIFLSHIHDDHCNLISLLQYNTRLHVLTTPLIYRMMLRKLALTIDRSEDSLQEYFAFHELLPGEETNYFGLRITPFYSSHSIPTIGARFEVTHSGSTYSVVFSGDTQSLADLKRMQLTGVVNQERYQQIADIYRTPTQLLIADGGEGQIHGDPADALLSPAERVVFLHLDKLPERFQAHFTTATSGKRFCVLRGETDYNLTRTIEFLLDYFKGLPPDWISHLMSNQQSRTFNAGDIIIREGAKSDGCVYILTTGYAQVIHHDGDKRHVLAQMEAGEIIGEMSVISGQGTRNASVVAISPVNVTAIAETAVRDYILHQGLESTIKKLWQHRELLQTLPYLRSLQQPVLRELAKLVTLENLPARHGPRALKAICDPFSLIFPLGQEIVLKRDTRTDTIPAHTAPILCTSGATLVTESELQFLLLHVDHATELRARIPAFRFFWEETLGLGLPNRLRI
ncbi:MAG: hypothetical protein RLZZ15_56 [Verrucomicrobiota bacterium]|jgi:CRP-like cAMP-binding protein